MTHPTNATRSPYAAQRLLEIKAEQAAKVEAEAQRAAELNAPHPADGERTANGRFARGNELGRLAPTKWPAGVSGNPAGKKPGSKRLLSDSFVKDLANVWRRKGKAVLEELAETNPAALAALVSRLLPADTLDRLEAVPHEGVTQIKRVIITPHGPEASRIGTGWMPDQAEPSPAPPAAAEPAPPERELLIDLRETARTRVEPLAKPKPPVYMPEPERRKREPIVYPPSGVI